MHEFPDTRNSLLLRIKDAADVEAWDEFAAAYRPVVYRIARRRGLQDADAQDLAQQVLASVSCAIGKWEIDSDRGKFRTWLSRVIHNAIVNVWQKKTSNVGQGGTSALNHLRHQSETETLNHKELDWEFRREAFRWAARQVREEFEESTWLAFWISAVEGKTVAEAASELKKTVGAVYTARSRIVKRLKQKVKEYE